MGKRGISICLGIISIFLLAFVSAEAITDDLHLNIQTINQSSGEVATGTFDFIFNIATGVVCPEGSSENCNCTGVVYSNSTTLSTDTRGIISYYLPNATASLDENTQYYLCYYRTGGGYAAWNDSAKIAKTVYSLTSEHVNLSNVEIDKNLEMGTYNVSASWFKGLFNWTTLTNWLSFDGATLSFNETKLNNTIDSRVSGNEATLNVNSSEYWITSEGSLSDVANISVSWLNNDLNWINTTSGDQNYLKLDGSNANSNIGIGAYNISAGWFKGLFNWTENSDYLSFDGATLSYSETKLNETIGIFNDSMKNYVDSQDLTYNTSLANFVEATYLRDDGDTATGNYSFDSGTLFIDSTNDRIGVGTISPDSKLEVSATGGSEMWLTDDTSADRYLVVNTTAINLMRPDASSVGLSISTETAGAWGAGTDAGDIIFKPNQIEAMRIDKDGNVSIVNDLNISGALYIGNSNIVDVYVDESGDTMTGNLNMSDNNITNIGRLGVGTSTPDVELEVSATGGAEIRVTDDTSANRYTYLNQTYLVMNRQDTSSLGFTFATQNSGSWGAGTDAGDLIFSPNNSEAMRIDQAGNVGIGTESPSYTLDVNGTARVDGILRVGTTDGQAEIKIIDSNGKTFSVNSGVAGNNIFGIRDDTAGSTRFVIDGDGNVGIGTSSPQNTLNVIGDINATTNIYGNAIYQNGNQVLDTTDNTTIYSYIDAQDTSYNSSLASWATDTFVDEAGDTMTGNLNMSGNDVWTTDVHGDAVSLRSTGESVLDVVDDSIIQHTNLSITASAGVVSATVYNEEFSGEDITYVVNKKYYILSDGSSTTLTAGTWINPQTNYLWVDSDGVLESSTTSPSGEYAWVGIVEIANVSGSEVEYYALQDEIPSGYEMIKHNYERAWYDGVLYESGIGITFTGEELATTSGYVRFGLTQTFYGARDTTGTTKFVWINDPDGAYSVHDSLDTITKYQDGSSIGVNKYFSVVVFGLVEDENNDYYYFNVQSEPTSEYNSISAAESDVDGKTNYNFPSGYERTGFRIARVILKRGVGDNTIQTLSNGLNYYQLLDEHQLVLGGASAIALGLDEVVQNNPNTDNNIISTANITADWFKGKFNWVIGSGSNYLSFNGTTLNFSESYLNTTIGIFNDSMKSYVDNKDDFYNTSLANFVEATYLRDDGDTATGNYSFDSGTLFIDSTNDRIGIGTTSPGYNLDIAGENGYINLDSRSSGSDGISRVRFVSGNSAGSWNAATIGYLKNSTDDRFGISLGSSNLNDAELTIVNGGNVGIGTINPASELHVKSSSGAGIITVDTTDTSYSMYKIYRQGSEKWAMYADGGNNLNFRYGGSAERMTILDTGEMGIATTSPSSTLEVNGSFNVSTSGSSLRVEDDGDVKIGI